jgi:hypothetical protein
MPDSGASAAVREILLWLAEGVIARTGGETRRANQRARRCSGGRRGRGTGGVASDQVSSAGRHGRERGEHQHPDQEGHAGQPYARLAR